MNIRQIISGIREYFRQNPLLTTWASTVWNLSYGLFNLLLAVSQKSYWYLTIAAFFLVLGTARLLSASAGKKYIRTAMRCCALAMILLAVIVCGMMILTIREAINPIKNPVFLYGQALYAFILLGLAIYNTRKAHRQNNRQMLLIRNLSFAGVIGSMLSLERSMLGTFSPPGDSEIVTIEMYTGALAFVLLLLLAFSLTYRSTKKILSDQ